MDKKDEESSSSGNPYKNIEKASVLQEVLFVFFFFLNLLKFKNRLEHLMKHQLMQENVFKF
jgi:hypothetical protein